MCFRGSTAEDQCCAYATFIMICKFNKNVNIYADTMRNDLFTKVFDFSYVQIIKVPGEG